MKFYEFNSFDYYALIGANDQNEAMKCYEEEVTDIDKAKGLPTEITKASAKKKYLNCCENKSKAGREFNKNIKDDRSYIILIDGSLI